MEEFCKKIIKRIQEESKKQELRARELKTSGNGNAIALYRLGIGQGLDKAKSMIRSILEYEYPNIFEKVKNEFKYD